MFKRYQAGDPMSLRHGDWNAAMDAAEAFRRERTHQGRGPWAGRLEETGLQTILVRNKTGSDLQPYYIGVLDAPAEDPASGGEYLAGFQLGRLMDIDDPDGPEEDELVVVVLEGIPQDEIGRAAVAGAVPVQVDFGAGAGGQVREWASAVAATVTHLAGSALGRIRLVWSPSGTPSGVKWCLAQLGPQGRSGGVRPAKAQSDYTGVGAPDPPTVSVKLTDDWDGTNEISAALACVLPYNANNSFPNVRSGDVIAVTFDPSGEHALVAVASHLDAAIGAIQMRVDESIPAGWELLYEGPGRFPVGWKDGDDDYDPPRTIEDNPTHSHDAHADHDTHEHSVNEAQVLETVNTAVDNDQAGSTISVALPSPGPGGSHLHDSNPVSTTAASLSSHSAHSDVVAVPPWFVVMFIERVN